MTMSCTICGCTRFTARKVLWPELVARADYTPEEAANIERQQGETCDRCGANLRAVALGRALQAVLGTELNLWEYAQTPEARGLRILDVNGVPGLSEALEGLPSYLRADYPAVDLQALPYPGGSFDVVLHSDTLEHVADPMAALRECGRVLGPKGSLCFTVPLRTGRLTEDRSGLPPYHHGSPLTSEDGMRVRTEFGADAWTFALRAGFSAVAIHEVAFPVAVALTASDFRAGTGFPSARAAEAPRSSPMGLGLRGAALKARRRLGRARSSIQRWLARRAGGKGSAYDQDGLYSFHDHSFMGDPAFLRAYRRGVEAAGDDYRWHWRVHTGLWAAAGAIRVPGDFVECGVNRGFMSSAIMDSLDWDTTGRTFYLLDTFAGMDEQALTPEERADGAEVRNRRNLESGFYTRDAEGVRRNFAQWRNTRIIAGAIPGTLGKVDAEAIAFLHLDLNSAVPELAAAEALWSRLSPGAFVLMDDYGFAGYQAQKGAMDKFAASHAVAILSLPTGQGLMIKPPGLHGGSH
jgi:SAM-dependent methyltransferase